MSNSAIGRRIMNIKMLGIVILLLSMTFVLGMDGCNRSGTGKTEAVVSESNPPTQKPDPSAQADSDESEDYNPETSLSPREYGRENPFAPLVAESRRSTRRAANTTAVSRIIRSDATRTETKAEETTISLTAVLGDAAIFEERGLSRSVSVGETIAGMEVLEIRNDEVVLSKENKGYRMTLGAQLNVTTSTGK